LLVVKKKFELHIYWMQMFSKAAARGHNTENAGTSSKNAVGKLRERRKTDRCALHMTLQFWSRAAELCIPAFAQTDFKISEHPGQRKTSSASVTAPNAATAKVHGTRLPVRPN